MATQTHILSHQQISGQIRDARRQIKQIPWNEYLIRIQLCPVKNRLTVEEFAKDNEGTLPESALDDSSYDWRGQGHS